jgi:hypothetical protein
MAQRVAYGPLVPSELSQTLRISHLYHYLLDQTHHPPRPIHPHTHASLVNVVLRVYSLPKLIAENEQLLGRDGN